MRKCFASLDCTSFSSLLGGLRKKFSGKKLEFILSGNEDLDNCVRDDWSRNCKHTALLISPEVKKTEGGDGGDDQTGAYDGIWSPGDKLTPPVTWDRLEDQKQPDLAIH